LKLKLIIFSLFISTIGLGQSSYHYADLLGDWQNESDDTDRIKICFDSATRRDSSMIRVVYIQSLYHTGTGECYPYWKFKYKSDIISTTLKGDSISQFNLGACWQCVLHEFNIVALTETELKISVKSIPYNVPGKEKQLKTIHFRKIKMDEETPLTDPKYLSIPEIYTVTY
jgi:hypothetical protein